MRRLGVPKVPEMAEDEARQQRVFTAGHVFHSWGQEITKKAGVSIAQEVELVDDDILVKGHFDDLVLINEKLILYDLKTAHSGAFKWKKDRPIGDYHRMQLATYMYMLRKPKNASVRNVKNQQRDDIKQVNEARILTISKDDLRLDEKQLLWTPQLEKDVVQYWKTLNGYWKNKKLPKCTCLDMDNGFMGKRSAKGKIYNDYFYEDEPCSLKYYQMWKEKQDENNK